MAKFSYLKILFLATVPAILGFPCTQCDDAVTLGATLTLESDQFSDTSVFVSIRSLASHSQSSLIFEDKEKGSPTKYFDFAGNITVKENAKYFVVSGWAFIPGYRDADFEIALIKGSDTLGILDTIPPDHWHSLKLKYFLSNDDKDYESIEIKGSPTVDTLYWKVEEGDAAC